MEALTHNLSDHHKKDMFLEKNGRKTRKAVWPTPRDQEAADYQFRAVESNETNPTLLVEVLTGFGATSIDFGTLA